MSLDKMRRVISFRVTQEQYQNIEERAAGAGESVPDFCRNVALSEQASTHGMSRTERFIYEELARVRYLVGMGFLMSAAGELTVEAWQKQTHNADTKGSKIADKLFERHREK